MASILQILRNPIYMGVSIWGKQPTRFRKRKPADPVRAEDTNEPLVTPEEYEQVQERIAACNARLLPQDRTEQAIVAQGGDQMAVKWSYSREMAFYP